MGLKLGANISKKQPAELVFISIIFVKDLIILHRHTIVVCKDLFVLTGAGGECLFLTKFSE